MAKRKGKSGSGEGQYTITQINLDKKGRWENETII